MADPAFDPYDVWLGIPPQQKKHFYNLLGVPLWEGDPQAVEAAAARRSAQLLPQLTTPHAAHATRILGELAQARACLLTPAKKSAYDAKLRPILEPGGPAPAAPAAVRPQAVAPQAVRPQGVAPQPAMGQPTAVQPVAARPVTAQPVTAQPVAGQSFAAQPIAAQPFTAQPVAARPMTAQPVAAQPLAAQPLAADPPGLLPTSQPNIGLGVDDFGLPSLPAMPQPEIGLPAMSYPQPSPAAPAPQRRPAPPPAEGPGLFSTVATIRFVAVFILGAGTLVWAVNNNWGGKPVKTGVLVLEFEEQGRDAIAVKIDGEPVEIPLKGPIELPLKPGSHKLLASRTGFADIEADIEMTKGSRRLLAGDWTATQSLRLELGGPETLAKTKIELDGALIEPNEEQRSAVTVDLPIKVGRHKLRLMREGFMPIDVALDITDNETRWFVPLWTTSLGEARDVLAKIDPTKHVLAGTWTREGDVLRNEPAEAPTIALPIRPVGGYDLQFDFTRTGSNAVIVDFPVGTARCRAVLGGWNGEASGFEPIEGRSAQRNPSSVRPGPIRSGEPNKVELSVRPTGDRCLLALRLNGVEYLRWAGPIAAFAPLPVSTDTAPPPPPGVPTLVSWFGKLEVREFVLRSADGGSSEWVDTLPAAGTPLAVTQAPKTIPGAPADAQRFDLLSQIELSRDRVNGTWRREGAALICGTDSNELFRLEIDLPDEYDLRLEVTRLEGSKGFYLRTRQGSFTPQINLDGMEGSGFDIEPGYGANPTTNKARLLPNNDQAYVIEYKIRRDGAAVTVDGAPALLYSGGYSEHRVHEEPRKGLMFAGNQSSLKLTKFELIPVAPKPAAETPSTPTTPVETEPTIVKVPVPEPAAVQAALKKLKQQYKAAYEAPGGNVDPALAAVLVLATRKSDMPAEERYAALREAIEQTSQRGAAQLATAAALELDRQFEIELWPLRIEILTETAKRARHYEALRQTIQEIVDLRPDLDTPEKLAEVSVLLTLIEATAKRLGDVNLAKRMQEEKKVLEQLKTPCQAAVKALADSTTPEGALALGSWLCLVRQDWTKGLPLLAQSGEPRLAAAAARLATNRQDAEAEKALAEALWDWKPAKGAAYPAATTRAIAREWYLKAGPDEAQLLRLQTAFHPDPVPLIPGAPGTYEIPLLGLAGFSGMTTYKTVGKVLPPSKVGNWCFVNGDFRFDYPPLAADTWVHEFSVKMPEPQGYLRMQYGDEDGTAVDIWWDKDDKKHYCRLSRIRRNNYTWYKTSHVQPGDWLNFVLYATPTRHYLHLNGSEIQTTEAYPFDLRPTFSGQSAALADIGTFRFRPMTVKDAAKIKYSRPIEPKKKAVIEHALKLSAENLGLTERPVPASGKGYRIASTDAPMQWIPPGSFTRELDPPVEIALTKGFWIGRYETTQAEWMAVMGSNPGRSAGSPFFPVDGISWDDAMKFCAKLNALERPRALGGYEYRLPTDAEWEYACRGGQPGEYSVPLREFWHVENSRGQLHPIGMKKANNWGLYDVHGNLFEWCLDARQYAPPEGVKRLENPGMEVDADEHLHIVRGGAWYLPSANCSATDVFYDRSRPAPGRGLRLVLAPTVKKK